MDPNPDDLLRAAQAGERQAMLALGLLWLGGEGGQAEVLRPMQGADWLQRAAEQGSAPACERMAVLCGAGACRPQDWSQAMHWLRKAAELGLASAVEQLALLAAGPSGEERSFDLQAWLTLPPKQVLCEAPRLRSFAGFVPPGVCRWLVARARERLVRARTYDVQSGAGVVAESRTNLEADFNIVQADMVLTVLRARIGMATGLPPAVMELSKVLHYTVGQQFAPHFDFLEADAQGLASELQVRGQRLVTFLIYLNDDFDGGETEFHAIGLRHRGRPGDALMFANVDPAGQPDRRTLHAGRPPTRGEKWLFSQWIRDRVPAAAAA